MHSTSHPTADTVPVRAPSPPAAPRVDPATHLVELTWSIDYADARKTRCRSVPRVPRSHPLAMAGRARFEGPLEKAMGWRYLCGNSEGL